MTCTDDLTAKCEKCEDDIEGSYSHICECLEVTGKIMCESCWDDWLEEKENEHDE